MAATVQEVLHELVRLSREQPAFDLIQYKNAVSAEQYRRLFELAVAHVERGASVLDWGCGNGHAAYALAALGYDVSAYTLNAARPASAVVPPARLSIGSESDPGSLPYPDASFDAVFSVGVLEHVRETGGTEAGSLLEIKRVLKRNGVFICYHFPNKYSYIDAVAKFLPGTHHHQYRYTAREIRQLCAAAGLELVEIGRYAALPRNPWMAMPRRIGDSPAVGWAWNRLDQLLDKLLSAIVQNYYFVARVAAV